MMPMNDLLQEIRKCTACEPKLPFGARPVVHVSPSSRIMIIGQAPGTKVHASGIPWDDASGRTLRKWLGLSPEEFYNEDHIAIVPMGFCYPGKGKSGDLPPRKECAELWHQRLWDALPNVELTLLIGQYAQNYYLKERKKKNLTETVRAYKEYLPQFFPLPHPSPRNRIWMKRNPWFELKVVPELQNRIRQIGP